MQENLPKVTVVTIVYNLIKAGRKKTFLQCVKSVKNQTYKNIEHIIIDGASDDGTLKLIKSTGLQCYSEPDEGIYDAMNKGIEKANGKYIAFLNSDDFWHGKTGVEDSVKALEESGADYSFADNIVYFSDKNEKLLWKADISNLIYGSHYCHQTMFIKTELLRELNGFDTNYKISADSDLSARLYAMKKKYVKVESVFTTYRIGGLSGDADAVRKEHSKAFYTHIGKDENLSLEDCEALWQQRGVGKMPKQKIISIYNKLRPSQFKEAYYNFVRNHKINLLFDATLLQNYYAKGAGRTGIYFVVENVLKELLKYDFLNVTLFIEDYAQESVRRLLEEKKEDFPNVSIYSTGLENFDIFFSPIYKIKDEIKNTGITCFTIVYDLIPIILPKYNNTTAPESWFMQMLNSLTDKDYLFSISEFTKQDFIKHIPHLDHAKITTALLAASENFYRDCDEKKHASIRDKYNIPHNVRYIFSLCTLEPRKNLIFAVKNFVKFIEKNSIDDLVFVLGGGYWDTFIARLNEEIDNLDAYRSKIIRAGYIDDEDLASLYSNAECSVYASIYEGFGLPPLEAMQCGCPLIVSNTTSLPEVVGDAGIMIDPKNDDELVDAYEKIYYDKNLCRKLSKNGLEQAKKFSWKKCTDIMVEKFLTVPLVTPLNLTPLQKLDEKKKCEKITYSIFGIPVLKIKNKKNKTKYYLFWIPIVQTKNTLDKKCICIFGKIQIFKWKREFK